MLPWCRFIPGQLSGLSSRLASKCGGAGVFEPNAAARGLMPLPQQLTSLLSKRRLTVGVAISGGVDSAVAALLLQRQGHEVFGIFMQNWDEGEEGTEGGSTCSQSADFAAAEAVCRHLAIPLRTTDFVAAYWNDVFSGFVEKCRRGLTPNPDLACNRHIKFGALLGSARALGAEKVATGHYARLRTNREGSVELLRASDTEKDQSYFLASLLPGSLRDVLFPVGGLSKAAVRSLASEAGLPNASRRSSAGICFIGRRKFADFVRAYAEPLPGTYVDVDSGRRLGPCDNLAAITYGQRASIGGSTDRMFVIGKDVPAGVVYVALGASHPALFTHTALLGSPSWLAGTPPPDLAHGKAMLCAYKARYRQDLGQCRIRLSRGRGSVETSAFTVLLPEDTPCEGDSTMQVELPIAAHALAPHQEFVLYSGDVCLGSAPILYPGKTLAESEVLRSEANTEFGASLGLIGCEQQL